MRIALFAAVLLFARSATAQDISGSFSAAFSEFNEFGVPIVALRLDLSCTLECPPSSPNLRYAVSGGADGHFLAEPSQKVGNVSYGFLSAVDPSGSSTYDSEAFPPGSNFNATATAVTCYCGNAVGQGGYIDLTTPDVSIPPWIFPPSEASTVGESLFIMIAAAPRGSETLDVEVTGAGISLSKSYSAAEAGGSGGSPGTVALEVTATEAGTVKVKAVVSPAGAEATKTFEVTASSEGGGALGDAGDEPGGPVGPTAAAIGGLLVLALLAGMTRSRARED